MVSPKENDSRGPPFLPAPVDLMRPIPSLEYFIVPVVAPRDDTAELHKCNKYGTKSIVIDEDAKLIGRRGH